MKLLKKQSNILTEHNPNGNGGLPAHEKQSFIAGDRLSFLLNSIPSAIVYVNAQQEYEYVNEAYKKIFDVEGKFTLGMKVVDFLGKEAFQAINKYIETALSGSQVQYETEININHKTIIIDATYTPEFDELGNVKGYIGIIKDVTEKTKIKNELKRKQAELQDYVDNAAISLHWVDKNGIIIWANQAELDMLGYSPEEYIGHHIAEFHAEEKVINDILTRLSANEVLRQYEAVLQHKDGSLRNVLINSNVLWENGKFIHTRCFTTDIHERKEMEKTLRETENRYKILMENTPAALYTCDAEGRITLYNKAAAALWGREPELGKDLWCGSLKIYEPDGVTPMPLENCPMAVALKEGHPVKGKEIVIERPDGVKRNVQPSPVPLFDEDGKISGAVNMLIDITDKKKADKDMAFLAAIVHSSTDPINSISLDGIITSWNEAAQSLFGYTSDEMIGQPITKLIPSERLEEENLLMNKLKKGELVKPFETTRITKDKKQIDVLLTVFPLKDKAGKIIGASRIVRDITSQKLAEQIIRENEERLRMAVQATNLGTWEYLPLEEKLTWSDECKKIYGVTEDVKIDYQLFSDHLFPEDATIAEEAIQQAMNPEGEGNYSIQYRILRYSDKQPRWIKAEGKVYFNPEKQAERFIGTVLDITEDKLQQQKLKDSFDLFTSMVDNVPVMIWMSGNDSFTDFFNKGWLEFTGRTIEQERNEGWIENVHPDDVSRCIENYKKSFEKQKGFYIEYRLKRHDGEYRWIADESVPRYERDGQFAGFISACVDIDDQKRYREVILESELRFKTISNASPVGLWMTDENAQNTFVNETWIGWTGIPFAKQLGTGWLDSVIEEDKKNAPAIFWESLLKREKYSTEFRIRKANGELIWCFTEGAPYYDVNGRFAGYAGSVTDVTEFKKIEERKDDFIKMASHELKTPITSINGFVELLLSIYNEQNDEKFHQAKPTIRTSLNSISRQVSKLTRLVAELLDLSRIESGKLDLHTSEFNFNELVEEAVQEARHSTTRHNILIHSDFEGSLYGDKDRISQVILNLLTNAIKYSPKADRIDIFISASQNTVSLKIKDYGIGIEKSNHEKIFQRFFRVEGKSEQTYPGFGIGLFISNEIVQRHNGSIMVESNKESGSTFTVTLPVTQNQPGEIQ